MTHLRPIPPAYKTRADLMNRPACADLATENGGNPCVWLLAYRCTCGDKWTEDRPDMADGVCPTCERVNGPEDDPVWLGPIDDTELMLWCHLPP